MNSEFLSLLWFSAWIADFWQTFWAIWEMGQTRVDSYFYSDNLSKNLISGVSDHHHHHHHHPYSFSDPLNASLAEVGVEPAAEPILLVPLRLSMPNVASSYSVWLWKGCPPKASLGIWSVKGVPFNFVNASPFNTLYKGGGSPDPKLLWALLHVFFGVPDHNNLVGLPHREAPPLDIS